MVQQDIQVIIQVSPFIEKGMPKVLRYVPLCEGECEKFTQEAVVGAVAYYEYM